MQSHQILMRKPEKTIGRFRLRCIEIFFKDEEELIWKAIHIYSKKSSNVILLKKFKNQNSNPFLLQYMYLNYNSLHSNDMCSVKKKM